jgi:RHS repeat-associated protein
VNNRYGVGPRIRKIDDKVLQYNGWGVLQERGSARIIKAASTAAAANALIVTSRATIEHDGLGRVVNDGFNHYTFTADGQVRTVSTQDGQPIARYRYNAMRQRVSKAVHSATGERTTYYLWQHGKLVAEIDGSGEHSGQIGAQYLYLSEDGKAQPLAKLEAAHASGNRTGQPRLLAIHANHRGEPTAMSDELQRVVWKARSDAWGFIDTAQTQAQSAELNLRLPGQYFDAESGLHDNWHRSYDPRPASTLKGRYLSPDPLGYPDGDDAYAYGNGDPINKTDPMGLYEEDVHYYMTFFLARMAGIGYQESLTIALATQYIDENSDTWPVDENNMQGNILNSAARNRLASYHFTTTPREYASLIEDYDTPRTAAELTYHLAIGGDLLSYTNRRYRDPVNPQLLNLQMASTRAITRCAKAQFFGELLHAFEDTFGHRDQGNQPIALNIGLGHGAFGHSPDKTYNHVVTMEEILGRSGLERLAVAEVGIWGQNEDRTFEMEREVFAKLKSYGGTTATNQITGRTVNFGELRRFLVAWNATHDIQTKIDDLSFKLEEYGLGPLPAFNVACAAAKRRAYVGGLDQNSFPGTILPSSTGSLQGVDAACN